MVNFKENYHFSRFQGVQLFPGGGPIAYDFPWGSGPPVPPLWIRTCIITIKVAFLILKKQLLLILKKSLLTEFEKKKIKILRKAMIFWGRACFGLVDRSTANQLLFQVGLF